MKTEKEIREKIAEQRLMQEGGSAFQVMQFAGRIDILEWVLQSPRKPKKAKKGARQ